MRERSPMGARVVPAAIRVRRMRVGAAAAAVAVAGAAALALTAGRTVHAAGGSDAPPALAVVAASASADRAREAYDGRVEAVRQTSVAAQVAGAIVAIEVHAGDRVQPGQVLLRLDAHAALQGVAAGEAQVQAARAAHESAAQELERQRRLYEKSYISQAALERAQESFRATQAQLAAQEAQAGVAHTQSDFYVVRAPYGGIVAQVPVALGDMALPGKALATMYDPSVLRVTVALPESMSASLAVAPQGAAGDAGVRLEFPDSGPESGIVPTRVQVLPTADPETHTVEVRLELPHGLVRVHPGDFARVWLPGVQAAASHITVPRRAVLRRAEMTGVYVLDPAGRPVLRQVRLGPERGDSIEILSGVGAGEKVVVDPEAAAHAR